MPRKSSQTNPSANQSAAVARQKSYGSFKLDAGQLQCARLTQARSNRHSRFGKIGRRSKRPSKSDDSLPTAVDRLERRAKSRVVHRIRGRFGRARKGEHRCFRVT